MIHGAQKWIKGTVMKEPLHLSRRERQIMDAIYARGEASVARILEGIPDPPTSGALRTLLHILEAKGHLRGRKDGKEVIYIPTRPRAAAAKSALARVLDTFFEGSIEQAVAAHLASRPQGMSEKELKRLADLVRQARQKGR
jgi:BlaI family transcriptional regulator, penicillinase repressor